MITERDYLDMNELAEDLRSEMQGPLLDAIKTEADRITDLADDESDALRAHLFLALVSCRARHPQMEPTEFWDEIIRQFRIVATWMANDLDDKPVGTVH